jgi:MoxR-like ATPase
VFSRLTSGGFSAFWEVDMAKSNVEAVRAKFEIARRDLGEILVDRDEEIELALTAMLAGEHLLLVGPPGCGKSLLVDSLLAWAGGRKFSALLTRFSMPEELYGPVSLAGLKEDRFVRVTTGKLPEAEFVFLDEIFKGSSAILNTLLKILNERTFDPGDGVLRLTPLKLCVAASNEWPSPESARDLAALFDRFVLRTTVTPVRTQEGRQRLLWGRHGVSGLSTRLEAADLAEACGRARAMSWTDEAREAMDTILRELTKEGVQPGDRRKVKTIGVVRAFAFLNGADSVRPEHLEIAARCLWDDPVEQPAVVARVIARVANPAGMRVNQLLMEAEQIVTDADPRDLAKAAASAAKLGEVERRLAEMGSEPRATKVRAHVREQIRKLRLASLTAV